MSDAPLHLQVVALQGALRAMLIAYETRVASDCQSTDELERQPWRCLEYVAAEDVLKATVNTAMGVKEMEADWRAIAEAASAMPTNAELVTYLRNISDYEPGDAQKIIDAAIAALSTSESSTERP